MKPDTKPCVVGALEIFDYPTREVVTRLMRCVGDDISKVLDDTMVDPKLRDALLCLVVCARAGVREYYGGWADDLTFSTIEREHALARDLANIEQRIETLDGSGTLKATKPDPQQVELAAMRASAAEILATTSELRAQVQQQRPYLPPDAPLSYATMRGLAILRQRERED
jgi:hypothetical protein